MAAKNMPGVANFRFLSGTVMVSYGNGACGGQVGIYRRSHSMPKLFPSAFRMLRSASNRLSSTLFPRVWRKPDTASLAGLSFWSYEFLLNMALGFTRNWREAGARRFFRNFLRIHVFLV